MDVTASLLETFIPGYETISGILFEIFGLDTTLIVSISFLVFAFIKAIDFLREHIKTLVMRFGTCSVEMTSDGETYDWITLWLASRDIGENSDNLLAVSTSRRTSGPFFDNSDSDSDSGDDNNGDLGQFPYRQGPKVQEYQPALYESQYFWYKRRLFYWVRKREKDDRVYFNRPPTVTEGRLFCLSQSTAPIKELIDVASKEYYGDFESKTIIRRPAPSEQRKYSGRSWKIAATRLSRPMQTVVIAAKQKNQLITDIKDYIQPKKDEWYAKRGIPYRRGYVSLPFDTWSILS
jgi:chaperone BCS1